LLVDYAFRITRCNIKEGLGVQRRGCIFRGSLENGYTMVNIYLQGGCITGRRRVKEQGRGNATDRISLPRAWLENGEADSLSGVSIWGKHASGLKKAQTVNWWSDAISVRNLDN